VRSQFFDRSRGGTRFQRPFLSSNPLNSQRVMLSGEHEVEIIGIVADTKYRRQREALKPLFYTPWQQDVAVIGGMSFALRTARSLRSFHYRCSLT
jgi:hypothetical protein